MAKTTIIKVCGLTRPDDMRAVAALGVQYAGMIFHAPSPRFAEGKADPAEIRKIRDVRKVGVFVNATPAYILEKQAEYGLDLAQLHGDETAADCRAVRSHLPVIKAFRLKDSAVFSQLRDYEDAADYFLFDTPGRLYGGNGELFDWSLLQQYTGTVPFFLSGGIGPADTERLRALAHPRLYAIDINSRFETKPGEKNIADIKQFIWHLNSI